MSWNHRVMEHHNKIADEEYVYYNIHEVYYDDAKDVVNGWTVNAIAPQGDTVEELRAELQRMLDALDKPVLDYEDKK